MFKSWDLTHLVTEIVQQNPTVISVAISYGKTVLKYWFQTLSSYTLTLMVIHFLQAGVNPPVIPSLQDKFPGIFGSFSAFSQTSFFQELPQDIRSRNTMSLGMFQLVYYQTKMSLETILTLSF